jgi:hypothetical protein
MTITDNQLEGEALCRLDYELLTWRRALLYTRFTIFYVGVGRTSAAPNTRKPRSSLVLFGEEPITY